ncbi:hypothetical protein ACOMHN_023304 [Nucella lapillus]
MLMPELVVDTLLEYLDSDSLLAFRMVNEHWKKTITASNSLWKKKCMWTDMHPEEVAKTPLSDTCFFDYFRACRRLSSRLAYYWVVDHGCAGHGCSLHSYLQASFPPYQHQFSYSHLLCDGSSMDYLYEQVVPRVFYRELIVIDVTIMAVLWRTERNDTHIVTRFGDRIFTITSSGNIELFSWDGVTREAINTGGALENATTLFVHEDARIILVGFADNKAVLVNEQMQLFPLNLPAPPQLSDQDNAESPEPLRHLLFWTPAFWEVGTLVVSMERKSSVCFVITNIGGKLLHHATVSFSRRISSSHPTTPGQRWFKLIAEVEGHVVEYAIHFEQDGIKMTEV